MQARGSAGEKTTLSADARQRLQALGYVASSADPGSRVYTDADDPKRLIEPSNDLQRAVTSFNAGNRAAAMAAVRAIMQQHPRFATAFGMFASMQRETGDLRGVEQVGKLIGVTGGVYGPCGHRRCNLLWSGPPGVRPPRGRPGRGGAARVRRRRREHPARGHGAGPAGAPAPAAPPRPGRAFRRRGARQPPPETPLTAKAECGVRSAESRGSRVGTVLTLSCLVRIPHSALRIPGVRGRMVRRRSGRGR